jgi:ubiquinone/menaquinone biosynthesis C-methylase UbiE
MDARIVWDVWRRILRDDELAAVVTGADAKHDLDATAVAVLDDYARTPQATETNIGMYRRGLVRNALAALSRVPLSQRALYMSGLDVDAVAEDFARARGYVDDGPYFWRLAGAFVAYLATRPEFAAASLQDVVALDLALVALARGLGDTTVELWPDVAAERRLPTDPATRFVASRAAVVAASAHDLTSWIENPRRYDPAEPLTASSRHWLIYFPTAESAPGYAELSERSGRVFDGLTTPKTAAEVAQALGTLSTDEALSVIHSLARLGVVVAEADASPTFVLTDDTFVSLDPAVEMLDGEIAGHRLLRHGYFEVGMAVPPGGGLSDFIATLASKPLRFGVLRSRFDDQRLIRTMLTTLWQHGFLHVTSQETVDLTQVRRVAADIRAPRLCRAVIVDLDSASTRDVRALIDAEANPPELRLRCARLADHATTLAELATLRHANQLRVHHTIVEASALNCGDDVVQSLRRLGAAVIVDVRWPTPESPIAGLDVLARACVPVHARMAPDRSLLDPATRARVIAWARSVFVTGLCLKLDADALWPAAQATDADFIDVFEATRALDEALGDVCIVNLPSDEVLLGNAAASADTLSDLARRYRAAYLRWRLPLLKLAEGDNTFSQTPESEEKLVRLREDLLPNHPELLRVGPGSVVVDVCGGNGRVARRLSPLVGDDGIVISVEMLRCVTDRARRFACELGFTNLQFRTGLAERIPLPDAAADAAVNEWTGAIWQLGLGPTMVAEMARVVRPGGRIAVTHRLVRLALHRLHDPWVQFADIYALMHGAFSRPELRVVVERVWGQTVSTLVGEKASAWRKHYLPRLINPFDVTYTHEDEPGPRADVCLTIIAERV